MVAPCSWAISNLAKNGSGLGSLSLAKIRSRRYLRPRLFRRGVKLLGKTPTCTSWRHLCAPKTESTSCRKEEFVKPETIPCVRLLLHVRVAIVTSCTCVRVRGCILLCDLQEFLVDIWTALTDCHWSFCVTQRHGIYYCRS